MNIDQTWKKIFNKHSYKDGITDAFSKAERVMNFKGFLQAAKEIRESSVKDFAAILQSYLVEETVGLDGKKDNDERLYAFEIQAVIKSVLEKYLKGSEVLK